ncbi:hypothetical protein ACTWKD_03325 [Halanaerobium saccharolyticum]|uniref:hypothetical protein n=1 Tax=Halanaerobium saccharolyticum TaxID=43595 RepID=UPI003FCCEBED
MAKKNKEQFKWADSQVFDYQVIKHPEKNKSHLEERKELIKQGEVECYEWWLCWRKH